MKKSGKNLIQKNYEDSLFDQKLYAKLLESVSGYCHSCQSLPLTHHCLLVF